MTGKSILRKVDICELLKIVENGSVIPSCGQYRVLHYRPNGAFSINNNLTAPSATSCTVLSDVNFCYTLIPRYRASERPVSLVLGRCGEPQVFAAIIKCFFGAAMVNLNHRIGNAKYETVHLNKNTLSINPLSAHCIPLLLFTRMATLCCPFICNYALVINDINLRCFTLGQRDVSLCGVRVRNCKSLARAIPALLRAAYHTVSTAWANASVLVFRTPLNCVFRLIHVPLLFHRTPETAEGMVG